MKKVKQYISSMIIFLNGCSSSGKSSMAKALQHLSLKPLLTLGIDSFIGMMPSKYWGSEEKASEGFKLVTSKTENKKIVEIKTGPFAEDILHSMPKVIKLLAEEGYDIIIDEVLFGDKILQHYVENLVNHKVYFIGVVCSLETIEEREILRGNRPVGMARGQINVVHLEPRYYDLSVDTTNNSVFNVAWDILDFIDNNPSPQGFKKLQEEFNILR